MTVVELADFVKIRRKRQIDEQKAVAQAAYVAGCIGSMALARNRPRFEDVFSFPKDESKSTEVEKSRLQMIAYAEYVNREARKTMRGGDSNA